VHRYQIVVTARRDGYAAYSPDAPEIEVRAPTVAECISQMRLAIAVEVERAAGPAAEPTVSRRRRLPASSLAERAGAGRARRTR